MTQRAAILGCLGTRLTREESRLFSRADPWGFILFARNVESKAQISALCDDLRASVGRQAPILIDQEGGRVARLRAPLVREWPAPLDHAEAAGADAARVLYLRYRLIAAELSALGIDVNCAPILDVARQNTHPFLRNRCYGGSAERVAELGRAVADGLLAGGVLPVMKHLPGHGLARTDSHLDLPRVTAPAEDLRATDFAPFRALADLPLGMTAHVVYEALDSAPATVSAPAIRLIRDEIGFDGLLMTDDISMQALGGSVEERAAAARAAGCDAVLHCNGDLAEMGRICDASGDMDEAAQARADAALACRRAPAPFDAHAALAELDTAAGGQGG